MVTPIAPLQQLPWHEPSIGPTPRRSLPVLSAITIVLGMLFLLNEHDFTPGHVVGEDYAEFQQKTQEALSEGNLVRKVVYPLLGLIGLGLLWQTAPRWPLRTDRAVLGWLAAYLGWCGATLLWADAPGLTIKRLVILYSVTLGVLGLARSVRLVELVWMMLAISAGLVCLNILLEVKWGIFRPWSGGYRFAGSVHPNSQGGYCAILTLSSFFLSFRDPRRRNLLWGVAGFALLMLILTKSRTCLMGCVLGGGLSWMIFATPKQRVVALILGSIGLSALLTLGALTSPDFAEKLSGAATLGRREGTFTLNGRIPLWAFLTRYMTGWRLLLGYGYDSFWTARRVAIISYQLEWNIPNSHSVVIENLLNLGLVGLGLFAALATAVTRRVWSSYLRLGLPEFGFALALTLFSALNSIFEASYTQPSGFDTFFSAAVFCSIALFRVDHPAAVELGYYRQRARQVRLSNSTAG